MKQLTCSLVGVPVQAGTSLPGCLMGPDAYRTAGLGAALCDLGHRVVDLGNVRASPSGPAGHDNPAIHQLDEVIGWTRTLQSVAYEAARTSDLPVFLGGDHSLALGTVPGVARFAAETGRPQFVLWLDAHPDLHTPATTKSGNLHGAPVAYFIGLDGFEGLFPPLQATVSAENVCMIGIRSVDPSEKQRIEETAICVHDMRSIDENGILSPLTTFLKKVKAAGGALHVSLDVDFLDPSIAPAVGTTVPGGATFREAHLIMETLCASGLVTSLDLVELNPFLDNRGQTATLMVDLCASLFGRTVLDRPTKSY